jgi:hypothetical protein
VETGAINGTAAGTLQARLADEIGEDEIPAIDRDVVVRQGGCE